MKGWRTAALVVSICAMALLLASAARHRLVEPADMTAFCDAGGQTLACWVRAWTIQAFVHQRIGWAALALALIATATGYRAIYLPLHLLIAAAALFVACAGLILYTTELCAPAVLLAALVFVRDGQAIAPANSSSKPQYDKA